VHQFIPLGATTSWLLLFFFFSLSLRSESTNRDWIFYSTIVDKETHTDDAARQQAKNNCYAIIMCTDFVVADSLVWVRVVSSVCVCVWALRKWNGTDGRWCATRKTVTEWTWDAGIRPGFIRSQGPCRVEAAAAAAATQNTLLRRESPLSLFLFLISLLLLYKPTSRRERHGTPPPPTTQPAHSHAKSYAKNKATPWCLLFLICFNITNVDVRITRMSVVID